MEDTKYYEMRLFLIRFFIIGMMAYPVEVLFTGVTSFIKSIYLYLTVQDHGFDMTTATKGYAGIFAVFIYCWAAIPFTFLTTPLRERIKDDLWVPRLGVILRGMVYGLIFMAIEFIIGGFLLLFNHRPWDYTNLPLDVLGVVTFVYLPFWTLAGIIGEMVHERLTQIDDILLNPEGYNSEVINKYFQKYKDKKIRKNTGVRRLVGKENSALVH